MASPAEPNDFLTNIRRLFAEGKADHQSIKDLMSSGNFAKENWKEHAKFDEAVSYNRNFVDGGDEQGYNLLILCWNPTKGSPIHDHDKSSCFLKVLAGKLEETKYEVPKPGEQLKMKERTVHSEGTLTYMDNSIGLHSVKNPSDSEGAVSLHLYYPPLTKCLKYDEEGNSTSCNIPVNKI